MAESREKSDGLREAFEKAAKEVYLDENFTVLFRRESDGGYSFMDIERAYEMWEAGRRDALEEQWISVEEKLPDETRQWENGAGSEWMLTHGRDGYCVAALVSHADDGKRVWRNWEDEPIRGVTHWHELPEPPKAAAIRALET